MTNENRTFTHDERASRTFRAWLDGESPNGENPDDFGPWKEPMLALRRAHEEGGTAAVIGECNALTNADPKFAALLANGAASSPPSFGTWSPRRELPADLPGVPSLDPDMIPEPLRDWLTDIADRACIPLEYVAIPAIVSLGALVGRSIGLRPNRRDNYLVVGNLWGAIVGRPGSMKSHAVSEALGPLRVLAEKATKRYDTERLRWEAHIETIETGIKVTKKKMEKADKHDMADLEEQLAKKLAEQRDEQPRERRYMTQDATVEKLGELLRANTHGLLVSRDELSGFLGMLNRDDREGDREFYLEGWNGTGSFTCDRIARGTVHIAAVCLSIVGGIQPGKLKPIIMATLAGGEGDDGLLQRFQLLVWPDRFPEWRRPEKDVDTEARRAAYATYERLDEIVPAEYGAEIPDDGEVPFLRFSPDGQAVYDLYRDTLELRVRSPRTGGHSGVRGAPREIPVAHAEARAPLPPRRRSCARRRVRGGGAIGRTVVRVPRSSRAESVCPGTRIARERGPSPREANREGRDP